MRCLCAAAGKGALPYRVGAHQGRGQLPEERRMFCLNRIRSLFTGPLFPPISRWGHISNTSSFPFSWPLLTHKSLPYSSSASSSYPPMPFRKARAPRERASLLALRVSEAEAGHRSVSRVRPPDSCLGSTAYKLGDPEGFLNLSSPNALPVQ